MSSSSRPSFSSGQGSADQPSSGQSSSRPSISSDRPPSPPQPLDQFSFHALISLVNAASTIHTGKAILDFAERLYGKDRVEAARLQRREDEKAHGMNGWHGEEPGQRALARAYYFLERGGKQAECEQLKHIALDGRVLSADFEYFVFECRRGRI